MPRKLEHDEVEKRVSKMYDGSYRLISMYTNMITPVNLLHLKCKTEYTVARLKGFLNENKNKCPICFKRTEFKSTKKITMLDLKERIKEQTGNEYSVLSLKIKNMNSKISMKHEKCGYIWDVKPEMFLGVKQSRCPQCSNENRGLYLRNPNFLQEVLNSKEYGIEYEWVGNPEYSYDNKKKYKIKHKICGLQYFVRPNDFQQGYRCPSCSNSKKSYYIKYIEKYFKSNKIEFIREKSFKNLKYKGKLYFDFYLPEYKLLIEYDGEQHFGRTFPRQSFEVQKIRDSIKNKWIKSSNKSLLRIKYSIKKYDKNKPYKIISKILNSVLFENKIPEYSFLIYLNKFTTDLIKENNYNKYCMAVAKLP